MSRINKLICLLVCLAISLGCFASCDILEALGSAEINPNKYEAKVRIVFATNDDKMKPAVDAMNSSSVIRADGENIVVITEASGKDTSLTDTYSLYEGTLYHWLLIASDIYSAETKEKAELDEIDKALLLNNVGPCANVDVSDFNSCEESGADGLYTYTCTEITDEGKESLLEILTPKFDTIGATVRIVDVSYILETKNDIELSSTLSCSFEITLGGEAYEITMRTYTDYDYTAKVNIEAPADAEGYTEVSYEEIIK